MLRVRNSKEKKKHLDGQKILETWSWDDEI